MALLVTGDPPELQSSSRATLFGCALVLDHMFETLAAIRDSERFLTEIVSDIEKGQKKA